jgi:hypothetical protein
MRAPWLVLILFVLLVVAGCNAEKGRKGSSWQRRRDAQRSSSSPFASLPTDGAVYLATSGATAVSLPFAQTVSLPAGRFLVASQAWQGRNIAEVSSVPAVPAAAPSLTAAVVTCSTAESYTPGQPPPTLLAESAPFLFSLTGNA